MVKKLIELDIIYSLFNKLTKDTTLPQLCRTTKSINLLKNNLRLIQLYPITLAITPHTWNNVIIQQRVIIERFLNFAFDTGKISASPLMRQLDFLKCYFFKTINSSLRYKLGINFQQSLYSFCREKRAIKFFKISCIIGYLYFLISFMTSFRII